MPVTIFNPSKDNYMDVSQPTVNHGVDATFQLQRTLVQRNTVLLSFNLSAITDYTTVVSANLEIHVTAGGSLSLPWQIHRLVRTTWSETESTWNIHQTGFVWTTSGAAHVGDDIDATNPDVISGSMPAGFTGWYDFGDVKDFVVDAIINRIGQVHLRIDQTARRAGDVYVFKSRETPVADGVEITRPKITVTTVVNPEGSNSGYALASYYGLVSPRIL